MFAPDNTEGFTGADIEILNQALEILLDGSTDEQLIRSYSDLINNNWNFDSVNTIESLTRTYSKTGE